MRCSIARPRETRGGNAKDYSSVAQTSRKSGFAVGVVFLGFRFLCIFPLEKLRISFSTSLIKFKLPPVGENMMVSLGHAKAPKQQDRSGFPADRGHSQKGVLGTVVTIATPSVGSDKNPL